MSNKYFYDYSTKYKCCIRSILSEKKLRDYHNKKSQSSRGLPHKKYSTNTLFLGKKNSVQPEINPDFLNFLGLNQNTISLLSFFCLVFKFVDTIFFSFSG